MVYGSLGLIQCVPGSEKYVFKSKILSLVDMRCPFFMFATRDFEGKEIEGQKQILLVQCLRAALNEKAASAIAYALVFCAIPEGT